MPVMITPASPARDRLALLVRRALRERDLSFERAAETMRLSREMIRRVARGKCDPPVSVVAQLVVGLSLDPREVFYGRFAGRVRKTVSRAA